MGNKQLADELQATVLADAALIDAATATQMIEDLLLRLPTAYAIDIASAYLHRPQTDPALHDRLAAWIFQGSDNPPKELSRQMGVPAYCLERLGRPTDAIRLHLIGARVVRDAAPPVWVEHRDACRRLRQGGVEARLAAAIEAEFGPCTEVDAAPSDDLPFPTEALAAEREAERSSAMAEWATTSEVSEAWNRRAIALYANVEDGLTRQDDLWEDIAKTWRDEAEALMESEDFDFTEIERICGKVEAALLDAQRVNEELGDASRVHELICEGLSSQSSLLQASALLQRQFDQSVAAAIQDALDRGDLAAGEQCLIEICDWIDDFTYQSDEDDDETAAQLDSADVEACAAFTARLQAVLVRGRAGLQAAALVRDEPAEFGELRERMAELAT